MRKFLMASRLSFVLALILGLGGVFGWWSVTSTGVLVLHIVFGAVFAISIWGAAALARGRGRISIWIGAFFADLGIVLALLELINHVPIWVYWHPILMLLAIGTAEMGASRERRSGGSPA